LIDGFRNRKLSESEALAFAEQALLLRFESRDQAPIEPGTLLTPRRPEDRPAISGRYLTEFSNVELNITGLMWSEWLCGVALYRPTHFAPAGVFSPHNFFPRDAAARFTMYCGTKHDLFAFFLNHFWGAPQKAGTVQWIDRGFRGFHGWTEAEESRAASGPMTAFWVEAGTEIGMETESPRCAEADGTIKVSKCWTAPFRPVSGTIKVSKR
jgi:hypothetical protein